MQIMDACVSQGNCFLQCVMSIRARIMNLFSIPFGQLVPVSAADLSGYCLLHLRAIVSFFHYAIVCCHLT